MNLAQRELAIIVPWVSNIGVLSLAEAIYVIEYAST